MLSTGLAARPDDDAGDAGGSKQADAILADCRKRHQRGTDCKHHQQHIDGARQHAHLGVVLAREQIVVDVEPEAPKVEIGGDVERDDRSPADQSDDRPLPINRVRSAAVSGGNGATGMAMIIARVSSASRERPRVCVKVENR